MIAKLFQALDSLNSFPEVSSQDLFDRFLPRTIVIGDYRLNADLQETEKDYTLTLDTPGVQNEDIDVSFDDVQQILSVSVQRTDAKAQDKTNYKIQERRAGAMKRSFYLPYADGKSIQAVLNNGVLSISANKIHRNTEKSQKIKVTSI